MNRRDNIKSLILGGISASLLGNSAFSKEIKATELKGKNEPGISNWHRMPDMSWTGPEYWANRLQDWHIMNGSLECIFQGEDRSLHHLTMQIGSSRNSFNSRLHLSISSDVIESENNRIGFLLGAKNWNLEYRASAIHGKGLKAGINTSGKLFIGDNIFSHIHIDRQQLQDGIILQVMAEPRGTQYCLYLTVFNEKGQNLAQVEKTGIQPEDLIGNIAILSDIEEFDNDARDNLVFRVKKWELSGEKFDHDPDQSFGPVCFTQYTKQDKLVKITAQLSPVPVPSKAILEINEGDGWKTLDEVNVDYPSYTARFRFNNWKFKDSVPFRVNYDLKYTDDTSENFYWQGTIAKEPLSSDAVKALVCSCNHDRGFPDQDIVEYASMHKPDLTMFLGDQFYEINGRFGFQKAPMEKAYLDYLRKWYMFGWSYRTLFQHVPNINLPDDHDVFQGNLFGANGIPLPKNSLGKSLNRDYGGYMMPPEWVNLAMTTQTSHMPDPYDPDPIEQGIHVFYSNWNYAGISFGIIEDRKFKSGPASILPENAKVRDAFVQNEKFEIKDRDFPDAELLGERQIKFLNEWVEDWGDDVEFKILLSAAPFHALQTLPDGNESNGMQQRLPVPEPGEYVEGDVPVADMDSGGWPQNRRDEVLRIIRKSYTLHLTGDQHLPSITQYGIEDFKDAGYAFAVPALANSWPRRWWPPIKKGHISPDGMPPYTGAHKDAFGNKMYVNAVANPVKTGLEPKNLYDRSPGYGIVTFNKQTREVDMECWPRYVNPGTHPEEQFKGWPLRVKQLDNFIPAKSYFLPTISISGATSPLVKVVDENEETQLALRIKGNQFQPRISKGGKFSVRVLDSKSGKSRELKDLEAKESFNDQKLDISI